MVWRFQEFSLSKALNHTDGHIGKHTKNVQNEEPR